ncbi:MAG: sugar nucleotide-binding protein [Magnetococcales bacterium]|nr:sugar nucleotide-binding protein [Magnetococcales bacterium]
MNGKTPTVLVIGAGGTIGGAVAADLRSRGWTVITTARKSGADLRLDLTAPSHDWPVLPRADVALVAAAVAIMSECRRDPETSARVNVVGTTELASRLVKQGTRVVYLSTNQVFDGLTAHRTADSAPCPRNEYGRQKAAGETAIRAMGGTVLRLSKVLEANSGIIPGWAETLMAGRAIQPFRDFNLAPVTLNHAVEACRTILADPQDGIFQLSGDADLPYSEMARRLACALAADPALVQPASFRDKGLLEEEFPPFSTMDVSGLTHRYGITQPRSEDVMDATIARVHP